MVETNITSSFITRYRVLLSCLLIATLASLYMMTYSARVDSGDSLRLFDIATSLVQYGDIGRDESIWFQPPVLINDRASYPLAESGIEELLAAYLVAGPVTITHLIPGIGYVHTAWLLNILIVALTGGLLFWYALRLGYDERLAVLTVIIYGTATIAFPYAKTLFREPAAMFLLLLAAFSLESLRQQAAQQRYFSLVLWALLALVSLLAAIQIKESVLMAIPALALLLIPVPAFISEKPSVRRFSALLLILLLVTVTTITFSQSIFQSLIDSTQPLLRRISAQPTFTRVALHTYLFSPGGSLWGTSPILLLAIPGLWLWWRNRQQRQVWFVIVLILSYAGGHALLTGQHWFGGTSWTPRFLVPVVPVAVLACLPLLKIMLQKKSLPLILLFIALMLYSYWIQFNAIALPWTHYPEVLPDHAPRLMEWSGGLNQPAYFRWVLLPGSWQSLGLDVAWARAGITQWLWIYLAMMSVSGLWTIHLLRRGNTTRAEMIILPVLQTVSILALGLSLNALYENDALYYQKRELNTIKNILAEEARPGEILLLSDNMYANFIMNHEDLPHPRSLVLPPQPGERSDQDEAVEVESHNPGDLLTWATVDILSHTAIHQDRLWLLANTGPFHPWSVRPVEQYLTYHHYPLREFNTSDPTVRLIEFSMINAPVPYDFMGPDHLTDLRYGDHIRLTGFTLPQGISYQPGDDLAVSLNWQTDTPLTTNYTVAWFVAPVGETVPAVQGMDSQPAFGFQPVQTWEPGIAVWDHRALTLPADLPAGDYQIWVMLYRNTPDGIQRLPVTGETILDGEIGILPRIIHVSSKN